MTPETLRSALEEVHEDAFGWAMTCARYNHEDASDILQATYVKVLSGKAKFGERSTFKTWLFGVIRNTGREISRKRAVRNALLLKFKPDPIVWKDPSEQTAEAERKTRILEAISTLSDRQREVIDLVFYHDLTIEEAANVMGIGLGSARTHYSRAKQNLSEALENERE